MNGVNLNQFQFEFDLTWMAFFQNAEGRTYTRYGGRDDSGPESHLTKASLVRVMRQVLQLHEKNDVQPVSTFEPVAKAVTTPSDIPPMRRMFARREQKCVHCHDVKFATLTQRYHEGKLQKEMVFTYPPPSNLGIHLDPDEQNLIARVDPDSAASTAGLRKGDVLQSAVGQRILTFADFTRVLELAPRSGTLPLIAKRGEREEGLKINLPEGWRGRGDQSWRESMGAIGPNAGFGIDKVTAAKRRELGLGEDALAVRVNFIWGQHARQAGIKVGDYVIAIDGKSSDMNGRQMHTSLGLNHDWGDKIEIVVRRGGEDVKLSMQFPDKPRY